MDRHGIARHKHAAVVAEILGLTSYSQGNRRLTTGATWSLEELRAVAEHFGDTLIDLVALEAGDRIIDAEIAIGPARVPCRVILGSLSTAKAGLVAVSIDSRWHVVTAPVIVHPAYDVRRILIDHRGSPRRVAVLDDHADSAQSIAEFLQSTGLDCESFNSLDAIQNADAYDGYVIDWIIERNGQKETVRELVNSIRSRDPQCPIVVLTGQIQADTDIENDIAAAIEQFNLKFCEKPARGPIIAAALMAGFSP